MRPLLFAAAAIIAAAQPQTHVVRVNADGTFTPQTLSIKSGDTVRWEGLTRSDSIVRVTPGPTYPAMCSLRSPFAAEDPNEFTGPPVYAASGIFTLSPLDGGFVERTGSTCPAGSRVDYTGDNGKVLCVGNGEYAATLDSTWRSPNATGVFIRLRWKDVNPSAGVYDFTILRRELEKAVKSGKVYSLGIKAGEDGTPDWIFSTNANDTPRANGGGGIPRLHLQDAGDQADGGCGVKLDLGNPTRPTYLQLYNAMITETAKVVRSRADWYRALAYIKLSGANLFTHENRLPNQCNKATQNGAQVNCICNPEVFAKDGYTPSGLYNFFDQQAALMKAQFPGKAISYALIQAGFPRIGETGSYMTYDGNSSDRNPIPGGVEQTTEILDRGQAKYKRDFVVQHNGLSQKGTGCPFDGVHPKPVRATTAAYDGPPGAGCPNPFVLREGAEGQLTGYQTTNKNDINNQTHLDLAFQNLWDNTDAMFLEIYEDVFWFAENTNRGILPRSGKTLGGWAEDLHKRRNDPIFPQYTAAGNPFPASYSYTFRTAGTQTLSYVHGMKCGLGKQEYGQILIDAQPPAIRSGGVISAAAFGQSTAIAPGTWIEIYGTNLASTTREWSGSDFNGINAPASLDGVSVRIANQPAYVRYVSPGQLNVQVPSNVPAGQQSIVVTTQAGSSAPFTVTVNAQQPGLLATSAFLIGGRQNAVALFPDGAYVLPPNAIPGVGSRRARAGDVITFYGIGFGAVTPAVPAGQVAQGSTALALPLQISIAGARAATTYAGLAPGAIGLYQFNVTIPPVAASDAAALTYSLAGVASPQQLVLAIGN